MTVESYPEYKRELSSLFGELSELHPAVTQDFSRLHKSAMSAGSLTVATKELIALGIAIADRCEGCIAYHVSGAQKAGASKEDIVETIGVAMQMGGGPAMIYACEALKALKQFADTQS